MLLTRTFGYGMGAAGKGLGSAQIGWAMAGALVAGVIVDRVARRAGIVGKIRLAAAVTLAAIPSSLAVLATNGTVATVLLAEIMFASAVYGTIMLSVIAEVAPLPRARALRSALCLRDDDDRRIARADRGRHAHRTGVPSPGAVGLSMAIVGVAALVASAALALFAAGQLRATGGGGAAMPDEFVMPDLVPRAA